VSEAVDEALHRIKQSLSQRDAEDVIRVLNDSSGSVREYAAEALGTIGDPRAVPALIETLGDSDYNVRRQSANALGKIGDARAREALEIVMKEDEHDYVKGAATRALRGITFSSLAYDAEQKVKDIGRDVEILKVKQEVGRLTKDDVKRIEEVYSKAKEVKSVVKSLKGHNPVF